MPSATQSLWLVHTSSSFVPHVATLQEPALTHACSLEPGLLHKLLFCPTSIHNQIQEVPLLPSSTKHKWCRNLRQALSHGGATRELG